MQKIIPHLWFNTQTEEAVAFYTSVFGNGKVLSTTHYTEVGYEIHGIKAGTVLTQAFEIEGYQFVALNGGPHFNFTPAISFMVHCKEPKEVEMLWETLSVGGTPLMNLDTYDFSPKYGWIKDKYGVTWQLITTDTPYQQKIVPALLFVQDKAGKADEAIQFYTSIFKDSSTGMIARYGGNQAPDKEGTIMYADFLLSGEKFIAMDSAQEHLFSFNEAISLLITCEDQKEIDYFWDKLSAVAESEQCGWLKDKYGVSWQIVPEGMDKMLNDPDKEKVNRVMRAMFQMKKIDRTALVEAFNG